MQRPVLLTYTTDGCKSKLDVLMGSLLQAALSKAIKRKRHRAALRSKAPQAAQPSATVLRIAIVQHYGYAVTRFVTIALWSLCVYPAL